EDIRLLAAEDCLRSRVDEERLALAIHGNDGSADTARQGCAQDAVPPMSLGGFADIAEFLSQLVFEAVQLGDLSAVLVQPALRIAQLTLKSLPLNVSPSQTFLQRT